MKKALSTQRSWAAGQINVAARRKDDTQLVSSGAPVLSNWMIETTETIVPRPGRSLTDVSAVGPRSDSVSIAGQQFIVNFGTNPAATGEGEILITRLSDGNIFSHASTDFLWRNATVGQISWTLAVNSIVVCFPGMRPQFFNYDTHAGTWSTVPFSFLSFQNQVQEPFYRSAALGVTFSYAQATDPITFGTSGTGRNPVVGQIGLILTASAPYFNSGMIGSILSILGQQVTITAVTDSTHATVNVTYVLPANVSCLVDNTTPFVPGQAAEFKIQGVKIEVSSVQQGVGATAPGGTIVGVLTSSALYPGATTTAGETLLSPLGFANVTFGPTVSGIAITEQWQEEFMSDSKGWPASCFYDRGRLGFCNFPQKPEAILWSRIGSLTSFWVDSSAAALYPDAGTFADDAILEFIPAGIDGAPRVLHVVPWGDEFVFTDGGIYEIPISASGNPLKPGSVEFRKISKGGSLPIRPVVTQDSIVYVADNNRASAIKRTGSYTNPYDATDIADAHSDLFTDPIAIAISTGSASIPERFIYVLNSDSTVVVGKYTSDRQFVGWAPWTSQVPAKWVTVIGPAVYYTILLNDYVIGLEDKSLYLDVPVNVASFPVPAFAGLTVALMDGAVDKGDYVIDGSGNIIPHTIGETFTGTTIAGLSYQSTFTPFVPLAGPGESIGQRQHRRKVTSWMVSFQNGTEFKLGKRQVSPLQVDGSEFIRPLGRYFDPSNQLVKNRPGPIRIVESSQEVTV